MHQRRKWQPSPIFLPRESQGQRSLVGCQLCPPGYISPGNHPNKSPSHLELSGLDILQPSWARLPPYSPTGRANHLLYLPSPKRVPTRTFAVIAPLPFCQDHSSPDQPLLPVKAVPPTRSQACQSIPIQPLLTSSLQASPPLR